MKDLCKFGELKLISRNGHLLGWTPYVEPPSIPLIKEKNHGKSDKYFVKLKLRRDPTLPTSDLYDLKMFFFDNGEPEEFWLIVHNFNTNLAASGML